MAGYRYMLTALNYIKNVVPVSKPNPFHNPLCLPSHSVLYPNRIITKPKEICTDCPAYDYFQKLAEHNWKDTVMLVVGAPKGVDENIMRMGIKEGVKQVANLDFDKANGETLQHMLCHEFRDGNKVKYVNCDVTNEQQLISRLQMLLKNKRNSHVIVNNVNFLNGCKSQDEIDCNLATFMNSSLTAFDMMRMDKAGTGGAIINMVALSPSSPHPNTSVCSATGSMDIILPSTLGLDHETFFHRTGVRIMTICYEASDDDRSTSIQMRARINPMATGSFQTSRRMTKSAAQAVINIYKIGDNGTIWLSKENKPTEDITQMIKKFYNISSNSEPELQRIAECN